MHRGYPVTDSRLHTVLLARLLHVQIVLPPVIQDLEKIFQQQRVHTWAVKLELDCGEGGPL